MAGTQKVTDDVLRQFEQELNERFGSVKQQLDSVEGKWQGQGAVSFDRKQTEINERMANIGNLLVRFQNPVNDNRRIAGSTDEEIYQALAGIDTGGSGSASGSAPSGKTSAFSGM